MSRRWTRWVLGASLALLAMGPAAMAEPQSPSGSALPPLLGRIVPGKAIGPVALGATLAELQPVIGEPDDVRTIDAERVLMQWREHSLVVGFERDRVVLVGTNSNQYRTSSGLMVGVPGSNALALFPGLTPPTVKGLFGLADDTMGINFLSHPVDENGTPLREHTLPEDWLIDEINVYQSPGERVIDRTEAPQP